MLHRINVGDYITATSPWREDETPRSPLTGTVAAIYPSTVGSGFWLKLVGRERLLPDDRILTVRSIQAKAA